MRKAIIIIIIVIVVALIFIIVKQNSRINSQISNSASTAANNVSSSTNNIPSSSVGKTEEKTLNFQGLERYYLIHFPSGFDPNKTYPLVLSLHGGGGNPAEFETKMGFDALADQSGYIVVYPAGTGRTKLLTWNPETHIQVYASEHNIDDVGFIKTLVQQLEKGQKINTNRIYIVGYSNGAMMTQRIASTYPDIFAAAVSVAGTIGGRANVNAPLKTIQKPADPFSFMEIHGMQDKTVNYYGGQTSPSIFFNQSNRIDLSVADTIKFWTDADGCASAAPIVTKTSDYTKDFYDKCKNGTNVTLYSLKNATHDSIWSDPADISQIIWNFLNNHIRG